MPYQVHAGRIRTWSLEAHVVDHCNLSCAHCCTLSPQLPPQAVSPGALERDLVRASAALAPAVFKLTGGEPALHPDLVGCLRAVRSSGIAEQVSLTTNGFLFERVPAGALRLLDRITLSLYASAPLADASLERIAGRCEEAAVTLSVKWVDRFGLMDAARPHESKQAVRRIYRQCWLKERCHMVRDGRFYACTRPPHVESRLRAQNRPPWPVQPGGATSVPSLAEVDGVALDEPDLSARLLRYLEDDEPLATCRYCLGVSGGWAPHRQLAGPIQAEAARP